MQKVKIKMQSDRATVNKRLKCKMQKLEIEYLNFDL